MMATTTNTKSLAAVLLVVCLVVSSSFGALIDIEDFGAIVDDDSLGVANRDAINAALQSAVAGDTVVVGEGKTYFALGGISASGLTNVTLKFDGTLRAVDDTDAWPMDDKKKNYAHFIALDNCAFLTITGHGLIDGQGKKWWNKEILGKLPAKRPKLIVISDTTDMLIENINMLNSPSFHLMMDDVARVEVRYVNINVDRSMVQDAKRRMRALRGFDQSKMDMESWFELQPEDLNTDGIDPKGRDIWIHDCTIVNDDDSIAVKPCSGKCVHSTCTENLLIENMVLTGFGASIGSVPPNEYVNCVRNVTFRNISMPGTGKGVYIKSNPSCDIEGLKTGIIQDILYEDITITKPLWWPIWIGPQQQHEPGDDLGEKCALSYPLRNQCPTQGCVDFRNITLRNVVVDDPMMSPGVILGNSTNPMEITFDNVQVNNPGWFPYWHKYKCENVVGTVINSSPVPDCFKEKTAVVAE